MKNAWLRGLQLALLSCLALASAPVLAATLEIFPSNADISCNEELENLANGLKPGASSSCTAARIRRRAGAPSP